MLYAILVKSFMTAIVFLPINIAYLTFSFLFFGQPIKGRAWQIVIFSFVQSFPITMLISKVPHAVYPWIYMLHFALLFRFWFRNLPSKNKLLIGGTAYLLNILLESLISVVVFFIFPAEIINRNLFYALIGMSPVLAFFSLISWSMYRSKIAPGRRILNALVNREQRSLIILVLLLLVQTVFYIVYGAFYSDNQKAVVSLSLIFSGNFCGLVVLYLILRVISSEKKHTYENTHHLYSQEIQRLFTQAKGQRHDLANHVQVISSFIKRGKYTELKKYAQELVDEISQMSDIFSIGNPELAALVHTKLVEATGKHIEFRIRFIQSEPFQFEDQTGGAIRTIETWIDKGFTQAMMNSSSERIVELIGELKEEGLIVQVNYAGTSGMLSGVTNRVSTFPIRIVGEQEQQKNALNWR